MKVKASGWCHDINLVNYRVRTVIEVVEYQGFTVPLQIQRLSNATYKVLRPGAFTAIRSKRGTPIASH